MPNGYKYSNLLLKLYLKSLRYEGMVRLNEYISYNVEMISAVSGIDIDSVRIAFNLFKQLKLIEVLDDGTIFMLEIQNYIGRSSTEADRVKNYRKKIEDAKGNVTNDVQMYDKCTTNDVQMMYKCTPEIEIEKEIEIEIEIDNSISKDILVPKHLVPIQERWNSLGLSKIRDIKGNRLKLLNARIKEYGIEQVLEAIENINYSPFLKGQNKTGWVIVFDWFIKPNNFVKVLEGNYKDKDSANGNYTSNNKKRLNKSSERAGMSSAEIEESLINNF